VTQFDRCLDPVWRRTPLLGVRVDITAVTTALDGEHTGG
jgi:hypothetical protein